MSELLFILYLVTYYVSIWNDKARSSSPLVGPNLCVVRAQAATKVVAEAEKKKREKKKAVVMAVARARDVRRAAQAQIRSGTTNWV